MIFIEYDIWVFFRKSVGKIQASLKPENKKNNGHFTYNTYDNLCKYLAEFFL